MPPPPHLTRYNVLEPVLAPVDRQLPALSWVCVVLTVTLRLSFQALGKDGREGGIEGGREDEREEEGM